MLATDLRELHDTFDSWINGRVDFTVTGAMEFRQRLAMATCRAALLELGINVDKLIAGEVAAITPGSNVTLFPSKEARRVRNERGVSP